MKDQLSRRNFLGTLGLSSLALTSFTSFSNDPSEQTPRTVLFQGDSITDGNRGRSSDPNHILGHGYAFSIASQLGSNYPERKLSFINKGISGNTIADLSARWASDATDLKPDVLSILVGINDVSLRIKNKQTAQPSTYESDYRKLLQKTRDALPTVKLIVGEPFILPVGMVNQDYDQWLNEVSAMQEVVKKMAREFDCIRLTYQQLFTKAVKSAPADYWIWDGIHPTFSGHGLMAKYWIDVVGKEIPALRLG